MTISFDLLFRSSKKEQLAGPPIAHIYVKYSGEEDGYRVITQRCISLNEMEAEIDRLKKELEDIRITAKKHFAKMNK